MTDCTDRLNGAGARAVIQRKRLFAMASPMAVAALLAAAPELADAQEVPPPEGAGSGGEIVVTAQRRSERITDVPYNITAVSGADIAASGVANPNDLQKVVAGLGSFGNGPAEQLGENNLSLRGLRTDAVGQTLSPRFTENSVATYFGDTPVFFPILMRDLQRVEVLRGPQGTLYGSGAQGGAIRFIPNRPQFDRFSGEINASAGITHSANQLNGSADGVLNLPLAENLAVRLTAAYVRQAGFIDQVNLLEVDADGAPVPSIAGDPTSGPVVGPIAKNTNSWDQWMVRPALRYEPTDWLELDLSYLHQQTKSDDVTSSNPAYVGGLRDVSSGFWPNAPYETRPGGKYRNTQAIEQPVEARLDLISGTATTHLGFADLTSVSSYYKTRTQAEASGDPNYVNPVFNFAVGYNHYPRFTAVVPFDIREKGFTQEVRLVSQMDSPFSYVIGGYYLRQNKVIDVDILVPGLQDFTDFVCATSLPNCVPGANPQLRDLVYASQQRFRTREIAGFGELTYRITDAWQVTGGIRVFKTKSEASVFQVYPFFGAPYGDGVTEPISQGASARGNSGSVSDKVFKVNTSYDIDRDTKVYATFAQGFRRGGVNPLSSTGPTASLPEHIVFEPDFADNFEIGIKGRALDRRMTYSVAAYWINLKNFQFNSLTPAFYSAVFNGSKARSRGFELEANFRATPRLTLAGSYAYTDATVQSPTVILDYEARTLVDDPTPVIIENPLASIAAGAKLPGVSAHSVTASADYEIPLRGDSKLVLHMNANYRSKQNNSISAGATNPNFYVIPGMFMADASVTYESGNNWSGTLFVTNLTNEIGYVGTQGVQTQVVAEPQSLLYATRSPSLPRTFGVRLHFGF